MAKSKVRNVVSVAVEEDEIPVQIESTWVEEPVIERPVFVSHLGSWWEMATGGIFLLFCWTLVRSWSVIWSQSDLGIAILFAMPVLFIVAITGRFAGEESVARKYTGIAFLVLGGLFAVMAMVQGPLPASSMAITLGITCTLFGWGMRRHLGETPVRCLSLGMLAAVPFVFLNGGFLESGGLNVVGLIHRWLDNASFWYTGVLADVNQLPYTPIEDGLQFAKGAITSAATFNNYAGILVAIIASLAFSVLARHSLLVTAMGLALAIFWWLVFRAFIHVGMVNSQMFDGPYLDVAMPIYMVLLLWLVILGTHFFLGSLFAPIPLDPQHYEIPPMTQIYNAMVSFPQLGPSSPAMNDDNASEMANEVNPEMDEEATAAP